MSRGDRLVVPTPDGDWPLQVAGIYADYGNPKEPDRGQCRGAVPAFSGDPADAARAARGARRKFRRWSPRCRRQFGLDGRNLLDQAALKAESTRIFNRTFAVTGALNAFTLGVAGVALLTSLLTLANSRLPQLAPLWAVGVTRRKLAAIELTKTMSVAFITALLALPLGLLVAWCLIAIVNVKAFGWRLPFHVFPLQLVKLLGVAHGGVVAGLAVAGRAAGAHAAGQPRQGFRQ